MSKKNSKAAKAARREEKFQKTTATKQVNPIVGITIMLSCKQGGVKKIHFTKELGKFTQTLNDVKFLGKNLVKTREECHQEIVHLHRSGQVLDNNFYNAATNFLVTHQIVSDFLDIYPNQPIAFFVAVNQDDFNAAMITGLDYKSWEIRTPSNCIIKN